MKEMWKDYALNAHLLDWVSIISSLIGISVTFNVRLASCLLSFLLFLLRCVAFFNSFTFLMFDLCFFSIILIRFFFPFSFLFIEPAISTTHCSRLYGIFADVDKCDVFWNCWNGEASRYQCSPGLAYDREARVCMWADQVPECRNEGKFYSIWLIQSVWSVRKSATIIHQPFLSYRK